jgi:charged multivesicular body protein 4
MMTLEREIIGIETANINKETMDAMKNAGSALKQIHGSLTVDTIDQTMWDFLQTPGILIISRLWSKQSLYWHLSREDLREQHAIQAEINEALKQGANVDALDEDELEAEFEDLQQEELDNKMLKSGAVPQDQLQRLPTPAGGECKFPFPRDRSKLMEPSVKGKTTRVEEEDDEEEELRKLHAEMAMWDAFDRIP